MTAPKNTDGPRHEKVRDQLFVDSLLLSDQLTIQQHLEAERILLLYQFAGGFLGSPSLTAVRVPGSRPEPYTSALMTLSRTLKRIRAKFGLAGVKAVEDHVIEDLRTDDQHTIELLAKVLTRLSGS